VLFSPVHGELNATQLAGWVLRDHLPVRMQLQIHQIVVGITPQDTDMKNAVVLLSGGLDSATVLAMAVRKVLIAMH